MEIVLVQTLLGMMLFRRQLLLLFLLVAYHSSIKAQNPLSKYSASWNQAVYLKANTAAKANFLSTKEKMVIYILNLARMNPPLFASTIVTKFPDRIEEDALALHPDFLSLLDTLKTLKPLPLLYPDSLCWVSARCHAVSSGKAGYVGHERISNECNAISYFDAECCQYGYNDPLEIVVTLLIDEDVPSLGHRQILLMRGLTKMGVAIAPHTAYESNTVLDFK